LSWRNGKEKEKERFFDFVPVPRFAHRDYAQNDERV